MPAPAKTTSSERRAASTTEASEASLLSFTRYLQLVKSSQISNATTEWRQASIPRDALIFRLEL
jgi:hypothetical protein